MSLNAVNNFVNIWFDFCSRQFQNRKQIVVGQIRSQLIFVRVFIIENVCSHTYVLPISNNNLQA